MKKLFVFIVSGIFAALIGFNIYLNYNNNSSFTMMDFSLKEALAQDESSNYCIKVVLNEEEHLLYTGNECCQTFVGTTKITTFVYLGKGCPSGVLEEVENHVAVFGTFCCA